MIEGGKSMQRMQYMAEESILALADLEEVAIRSLGLKP
jgi:hypothetical protein